MRVDSKGESNHEEPLEALLRILDFIGNAMGSHLKVLSDRVKR